MMWTARDLTIQCVIGILIRNYNLGFWRQLPYTLELYLVDQAPLWSIKSDIKKELNLNPVINKWHEIICMILWSTHYELKFLDPPPSNYIDPLPAGCNWAATITAVHSSSPFSANIAHCWCTFWLQIKIIWRQWW